jgi:hypothetical protein
MKYGACHTHSVRTSNVKIALDVYRHLPSLELHPAVALVEAIPRNWFRDIKFLDLIPRF